MRKRFRELAARHQDPIYTFAYYHLNNREEAEDVTQEVLIKLWRNMEKIDLKTASLWIQRVTRNACIDVIRGRRRYEMRMISGSDGFETMQVATSEPSPEAVLEASELRDRIRSALGVINEPYKSIVILREIQDMKYQQISEMMEMPLNTVKTYLHRGRRMLREQLRENTGHETF